ncbi:MAG: hypothetical protein ABEJ77_03670 [Halanaeroarchaeum sp.]
MVEAPVFTRRRRPRVSRQTVALLSGLVAVEAALLVLYAVTSDGIITEPLVFVYPFVWIDASILALLTTDRPSGTTRHRVAAGLIGVAYFGVLGYFGGLFGAGHGMIPLHVNWTLPPGYGPVLLYDGSLVRLVLEPFKVVGYLTLAYFVYATILDATAGAISGLVGLFSCVSCTWPILGTIATSIFGSGSAVAAFALSQSYGLGTLVFLSALALLYYRPLL